MTKNSGLASSQTLILGAVGLLVAALAAAFGLGLFETDEPKDMPGKTVSEQAQEQPTQTAGAGDGKPAPVTEPAAEPEVVPAEGAVEDTAEAVSVAPEEAPVAEPAAETAPLPAAPKFDVVRVEPDGNTLVAGVAAGGELVEIQLDRVSVASVKPGPDGKFTAFLTLDPSEIPRLMSLLLHAGEARIASEDQVIIAPVKPVVVAEAAPAATPETPETGDAAPMDGAEEKSAETATEDAPQETADAMKSAAEVVKIAKENATVETIVTEGKVAEAEDPVPAAPEAEPAAPAVLLAGKEGVSVIQPAQAGDAPSGLVLDAISYSDGGAVELTGRGAGGATIRAYLNNTVRATVVIAETGQWTTLLTDVAPGIYTLRIDQVDAAGKVTSRIETPFKREAPENIVAAEAAQAQADTDQGRATAPIRVVTIQPGNTLWAIARDQYGEGMLYVRLFEANRDLIRNPDLIYPGQVFEIPRD